MGLFYDDVDRRLADYISLILSRRNMTWESVSRTMGGVELHELCARVRASALNEPRVAVAILAFLLPGVKLTAVEIQDLGEICERAAGRRCRTHRPSARNSAEEDGFGGRMRLARERIGLSQTDLARRFPCGVSDIMELEHAKKPDPSTPLSWVLRVADTVRTDVIELLGSQCQEEFDNVFVYEIIDAGMAGTLDRAERDAARDLDAMDDSITFKEFDRMRPWFAKKLVEHLRTAKRAQVMHYRRSERFRLDEEDLLKKLREVRNNG